MTDNSVQVKNIKEKKFLILTNRKRPHKRQRVLCNVFLKIYMSTDVEWTNERMNERKGSKRKERKERNTEDIFLSNCVTLLSRVDANVDDVDDEDVDEDDGGTYIKQLALKRHWRISCNGS